MKKFFTTNANVMLLTNVIGADDTRGRDVDRLHAGFRLANFTDKLDDSTT